MLDTPENNFCTMNPLHATEYLTFSEGNLKVTSSSGNWGTVAGSIGVSSGKWYWEVKMTSDLSHNRMGILESLNAGNFQLHNTDHALGTNSLEYAYRVGDGSKYNGGTRTASYGDTFADGDIGGVTLDMDARTLTFYRNGVSQGIAYSSIPAGQWLPAHSVHASPEAGHYNFGQGDPDGENNFTDSSGKGGFRFEPPSGFLSLCTANMSDNSYAPIGPNSATGNPDQHFDTLLYSGDGTTDKRIGGLAFQPDFVWIKSRSTTHSHGLFDSVRGTEGRLYSDATSSEQFTSGQMDSFNGDGFTVGSHVHFNTDTHNYVAWCWKAGNETTINNDGDVQSTISVNTDAGFSIVSWDGTGSAATVGHGLTSAPELIIVKAREITSPWAVYHKDLADDQYMRLNEYATVYTSSARFNSTDPTATVFSTGNDSSVSDSGGNLIAYCWHSVEGYSKIGSYEGNNNADGPFVYLGFKPAFIIIRSIEGGNRGWMLVDNKRSTFNPIDQILDAQDTSAESTLYASPVDFLSNGFKLRCDEGNFNNSETHLYMAWAEMPFKYATAR
tara:strand:- start:437 stop:2104 length:1668 start_codon:yes stop_codon:yes gene_type:complete